MYDGRAFKISICPSPKAVEQDRLHWDNYEQKIRQRSQTFFGHTDLRSQASPPSRMARQHTTFQPSSGGRSPNKLTKDYCKDLNYHAACACQRRLTPERAFTRASK